MMNQWLPVAEENTLPTYATHNIGETRPHITLYSCVHHLSSLAAEAAPLLLPPQTSYTNTHTHTGVAGFVVNDHNEVLLVQEKWLRNIKFIHWKLPGGVAETGRQTCGVIEIPNLSSAMLLVLTRPTFPTGEDLWQTAIRETFEETGVRSEFVAVLCFRHMHGYRWGTDDLYFACLLRPLNTDIKINPSEIADAKWMDVSV